MNILLSTPACLTRIAKCWQSQLLSIFLGITHLFSNQVCKSGIAYPLLVRRKVFSKEIPLTFMEMDTSCRTQASRKAYELLSWCVMLTLNTVVFKLILLSLKRKRHFNHTPNPLYFQRCRFTSWDVSRHFIHTIFPANRFVTPTRIVTAVTAVTPVTAHSRNQ